jgi:hypothetical protein
MSNRHARVIHRQASGSRRQAVSLPMKIAQDCRCYDFTLRTHVHTNYQGITAMSITRNISIACIAALLAACSATPSKPVTPPAPVAPAVADISGKWIFTVQSPTGAVDANMTVNQTGTAINGTMDSQMGVVDYKGSVNGKEVKFSYSVEKFGAPAGTVFDYVGTVEGNAMAGKATFAAFGEGSWSAKRP